jgi:hypothetical protein
MNYDVDLLVPNCLHPRVFGDVGLDEFDLFITLIGSGAIPQVNSHYLAYRGDCGQRLDQHRADVASRPGDQDVGWHGRSRSPETDFGRIGIST